MLKATDYECQRSITAIMLKQCECDRQRGDAVAGRVMGTRKGELW